MSGNESFHDLAGRFHRVSAPVSRHAMGMEWETARTFDVALNQAGAGLHLPRPVASRQLAALPGTKHVFKERVSDGRCCDARFHRQARPAKVDAHKHKQLATHEWSIEIEDPRRWACASEPASFRCVPSGAARPVGRVVATSQCPGVTRWAGSMSGG